MKIEAGKYYRTRDGRKVGPMQHYQFSIDGRHPWHEGDHSGMLWMVDGTGYEGKYPDQDLIAEWTDEPEQGTLTELNVKPGDVLQWVGGNPYPCKVVRVTNLFVYMSTPGGSVDYSLAYCKHPWEVISRASQSTTPAPDVVTPDTGLTPTPTRTITTHGTWTPHGPKPKTQYVYSLTFDLDAEGHPIWSSAKVTGR